MEEASQDGFTTWVEEELDERNDHLNDSSIQRKAEGWLRLMRGDDLDRISNELCLSPHVLRQWQKQLTKHF